MVNVFGNVSKFLVNKYALLSPIFPSSHSQFNNHPLWIKLTALSAHLTVKFSAEEEKKQGQRQDKRKGIGKKWGEQR